MQKIVHAIGLLLSCATLFLASRAACQPVPGYNAKFYPTVLESAVGVATPFLLQQGFFTAPGVSIYRDTLIECEGVRYGVTNLYQNPVDLNANGYILSGSDYARYEVESLRGVWPDGMPNVLYDKDLKEYRSLVDCVGYGVRLLAAVGDTSAARNAYLSLITAVKDSDRTHFAPRGVVPSAFEVGIAFPNLPTTGAKGWTYVAGSVMTDSIEAYNRRSYPALRAYTGRGLGGYDRAEPGDVLAFAYAPGGESNGHFMVIAQRPARIGFDTMRAHYPNVSDATINTFLARYHVWATPLYDCSGKEAHFWDSRRFTSGIGHGTLWMLTDTLLEEPRGFIFKKPADTATAISASYMSAIHTWAITVGRFKTSGLGTEDADDGAAPLRFDVAQNHPNPFNPVTSIACTLPANGAVTLTVRDVLGTVVRESTNLNASAGSHRFTLDARNLPSGVYFYSIDATAFSSGRHYRATRKMVLMR